MMLGVAIAQAMLANDQHDDVAGGNGKIWSQVCLVNEKRNEMKRYCIGVCVGE